MSFLMQLAKHNIVNYLIIEQLPPEQFILEAVNSTWVHPTLVSFKRSFLLVTEIISIGQNARVCAIYPRVQELM